MNQKIYKREGRRFVQIQDTTGMYLQTDGTFQKEKDNNSIGLCVLQTMSIRKVVSLVPYVGTWDDCATHCKLGRILGYPAHMPTRQEMFLVQSFIEKEKLPKRTYWTVEESCYSSSGAWGVDFGLSDYFGYCDLNSKSYTGSVLAFVDIKI